jgi:thiol:disulfide interchange protein
MLSCNTRALHTAAVLVVTAVAGGLAQVGPPRATVVPIVEKDATPAGDQARVALRVALPEGLHANSNKPRDPSLIAMELRIEPPPGVTVEEIAWPEPTDLKQEGSELPLAVFEREFTIGASLRVDPQVARGETPVTARLRYQACDEKMCYFPTTADSSWTLRIVEPGTRVASVNAEAFRDIRFGHGERPAASPAPADPDGPPAGDRTDDGDALRALEKFDVRGTTAGYMDTEDFLQFIRNAEAGVTEEGWFEGRGPLAILFIVLIGGLALNLTPCVLPMIPINLAIIGAGVRAGSRARGFFLGAAYGAAMAVVYGTLGLIVILTAGTFGTINASPWFNLGIAVLFVVLALAMFDVLVIDFSRLSNRFHIQEGGRSAFLVAFSMGAVAALLAGACVAPVVIQVVLFSSNLYATGTTIALALPFFLGVGMALPWPIAGAGIAALPKPGAWMERVKQAFGVVILGTAVYYAYTAYGLFANRWVDPAQVASSVQEKLNEGWHASLAGGLAVAERERKPVLIDLWATWCKNCLVMDRTTLAQTEVTEALSDYVRIKFQAEDLSDPRVAAVMRHLGAIGLPTYAIMELRE